MTNALLESGGVTEIGSLRDIRLNRGGELVTSLDLYDLLINGDTSGDQRLLPGDVIFIPPIGDTVAVGGAVKRPAVYETRGTTSVSDIVRLAGGLASDAFTSRSADPTDTNPGSDHGQAGTDCSVHSVGVLLTQDQSIDAQFLGKGGCTEQEATHHEKQDKQ